MRCKKFMMRVYWGCLLNETVRIKHHVYLPARGKCHEDMFNETPFCSTFPESI